MAGYLIDTNHLSAGILRVSEVRDRLYQLRRAGIKLGTCMPVICELEAGIQNTNRPQACYRHLRGLLEYVRLWPIDFEIAKLFGEIYLDLRGRGKILSHVDVVLAALAQHFNVTLLTTDRDFEALPDIRTENWLS